MNEHECKWHDLGEGPFATIDEAKTFADAEVAFPCRFISKDDGWHIIILSPYSQD